MILELVHKEYKENLAPKETLSLYRTILNWVVKLLMVGAFIALEVYIYFSLEKKLDEFSTYGSYDFLLLFLFILLIFTIGAGVVKARNVFFKKTDSAIMLHLPLNNDSIVLSKTIFTYLYNVLVNLIISLPLLICYGVSQGENRIIYSFYYGILVLYPFFVSIFSTGITLLILPLYNKIYNFLKNKNILQMLIATVLVILLCIGYRYVLSLFVNLLNNSKLDSMFSASFLTSLHNATNYFYPVSGYCALLLRRSDASSLMLISFGIVLLSIGAGFIISSLSYTHYLKKEFSENSNTKVKTKKNKFLTQTKAFFKKEIVLIFRNSNYLFSYTSLLIMQPFLAYVVISTLNSLLFDNLKMLLTYFPELINGLNILLILLFSSIISSGGSDVFSREGKGILVLKYLPLSPIKICLIKISVPLAFSIFSLLVTNVILLSLGEITVKCFLISLLLGLILQVSLALSSIYIDMIKLDENKNNNISFLSTLISFVLPLVIFLMHFLMTFYKVKVAIIYGSELGLTLIILIILLILFKPLVNKYFIRMRVNLNE